LLQQIKTIMTQLQKTKNKLIESFQLENMFKPNRIKSVRAIFGILLIFLILAAVATIAKLIKIENEIRYPLFSNGIDVLSAYKTNLTLFSAIISLEFIHLSIGALLAYYFLQFLKSIDLNEPFKNLSSKIYISTVAKLGVLLFLVDFINRLLMQQMESVASNLQKVSLINIEYLILVDLLFVFAIIFSRGIDLKNEIDLVV
jgi:hypothetical protein